MLLKVRRIDKRIALPAYKSEYAAGLDLVCPTTEVLFYGTVNVIRLGIAVEIQEGYEGQLRLRSSLAKDGLIIPNAPGTIDADYRGELMVILMNLRNPPVTIYAGNRIVQLVISPVARVEVQAVDHLSDTDRGEGGFGSTGRS